MAYGDKHWYDYEDDDGTPLSILLAEQTAAVDGFVKTTAAKQQMHKGRFKPRHVGIKDPVTKRVRQYPCKNRTGKYNAVGQDGISITVFGTAIPNCSIVGRTGEKGGS